MHIVIDRNEFKKMLSVASEICKPSNNLLTETILIKADKENNEIICLFFNFSLKVEYKIKNEEKYQILESGTILTNFNFINVIFTKLSSGNVELKLVDTVILKIAKDDFVSNINILDPSLFVEYKLTHEDNDKSYKLSTNLFKDIKNKLFQCCLVKEGSSKTSSLNETILSNVCLNSDNDYQELNIYTTDSFRVALLTINDFNERINVTFDQDFINFIINNFEDEITFYEKNNQIILSNHNMLISYKKSELNFPNILNVMNDNDIVASAKINAKKLFNAIDRGYFVVANEKLPSIDWIVQENQLIINFKSANIGNVTETIQLEEFKGEVSKVLMNAKLLLPMLRAFNDQDILVNWVFSKNQYRLLFKDCENHNFKQLLLLLRN